MRRSRAFASPFVVTIAACSGGGGAGSGPAREPTGSATPWADTVRAEPPRGEYRATHRPVRAVGDIWFDDPVCRQLGDDRAENVVDCPDDVLPAPEEGDLVVTPHDGSTKCYLVYERHLGDRTSRYLFDEGRVRCPPNVIVPDPDVIELGNEQYRLERETLTCSRRVWANPPYSEDAPCPAALLPEVTDDVELTRETGGHCFVGKVEVKCR